MQVSETPTYDDVRADLMRVIKEKFLQDKPVELTYDYLLLENGIVDSLSMMTLVLHLETTYSLDFYKTPVTRDDFRSIDTIAEMICRLTGPRA